MILIIDKSKKNGNATAEIFKYMGILARAETPESALSEISLFYRAILIVNPKNIYDPKNYVQKLRSYVKNMPIFAISDEEYNGIGVFDATFKDGITSSKLYSSIINYCKGYGLPEIGNYKLAGIDASAKFRCVSYFSEVIPFTKTESLIIRLLIRTYPSPMPAKNILKYAFSQSKLPDIRGIRTHISGINKKFRSIFERNLITTRDSKGYIILTPELISERSRELTSATN